MKLKVKQCIFFKRTTGTQTLLFSMARHVSGQLALAVTWELQETTYCLYLKKLFLKCQDQHFIVYPKFLGPSKVNSWVINICQVILVQERKTHTYTHSPCFQNSILSSLSLFIVMLISCLFSFSSAFRFSENSI